jgi:hypothetical protein
MIDDEPSTMESFMILKTTDQWREAVLQRRIERVRAGSHDPLLDDIVNRLSALPELDGWMIPALLDAAVEEWESRIRDFYSQCAEIAAQHAFEDAKASRFPEPF